MSPNRRIFLNVIASYGRSAYTLLMGLLCGRWTFIALGEVDYGLIGVVGGLIAFMSYFQRLLSGGVERFYALCIGEEERNYTQGLEHCREWFTTSLCINITIPSLLLFIGYPLGEWAVRCFLTIPSERVTACLWVWRFSCISFILSLMCAPFNTMYVAKQEIAEQTVYGFATTTINVLFLYYAVNHPRDWLALFAGWSAVLNLSPSLIMACRSFRKYKECRFRWRYVGNLGRLKQLLWWNGWLTFGVTSDLLRKQGITVLINKVFGPILNASWNVGNTLSSQCATLSSSLLGAFYPAVYNAWGAGRYDYAKRMGYRVCRFSVLLVLLFAVPLALEVDQVLLLWLKTPPQHSALLCIFVLCAIIAEKMTDGIRFVINANGNIALYQTLVGGMGLIALPLAIAFAIAGRSIYYVGLAVAISWFAQSAMRVYLGRRVLNMSVIYWLRSVFVPLMFLTAIATLVGLVPRLLLGPSLSRILVTTAITSSVLIVIGWLLVLDREEKKFVNDKVNAVIRRWTLA